jgi:hypothetical protein
MIDNKTAYNSEYPATLRSAQIAPFGRNFGYSRNVSSNIEDKTERQKRTKKQWKK